MFRNQDLFPNCNTTEEDEQFKFRLHAPTIMGRASKPLQINKPKMLNSSENKLPQKNNRGDIYQ
jgi:hypothetical protein